MAREEGTVETSAASFPDLTQQPELVVGLLASPGPASELTESLLPEIADRLAVQLPGARWKVEFVSDRLGGPPDASRPWLAAGRLRNRSPTADRAATRDRTCQRDTWRRGAVHAGARPGRGAQARGRDDRPPGRAHAGRHDAGSGRR